MNVAAAGINNRQANRRQEGGRLEAVQDKKGDNWMMKSWHCLHSHQEQWLCSNSRYYKGGAAPTI
jgi:hypothetical protein